jgi:branched-chain amino acid transport system substrate-binding protein
MGGDGIAGAAFIELATPAIAEGTYATMIGGDMKMLPNAQEFITVYEKKFGPLGQWSAYGYDAANIVISAIRKAGTANRQTILDAMHQIKDFQGVTGITNFDEKGDNLNQFIGVFKVEDGKLKYVGPAS